jgi:hypothetical protein
MRKSMTTFQFISTFATLVPIVDTSGAHEFYKGLLLRMRDSYTNPYESKRIE